MTAERTSHYNLEALSITDLRSVRRQLHYADHADVVADALLAYRDATRDTYLESDTPLVYRPYYAKGDWRNSLHRRGIARKMRAIRNAVRELA